VNAPYTVTPAVAADAEATLLALWANSFEWLRGEAARKKLEHFYLRNPVGAGPVFLLRHNASETDVGVQTLVSRRFFVDGRTLMAGTMADYAVDPAHRSLGPALQLLKASIAASKSSLAFVYGLPNRKAEPILRRAGLEPVLEMGRYAAPLRSRTYLASRLPGTLLAPASLVADVALAVVDRLRAARLAAGVRWVDPDDADIEAIWQGALHSGLLLSDRSAALLHWRFDAKDAGGRRIDVARDDRDGSVLGYVVWSLHNDVAVVSDFLCASPRRDTARLFAAFRCRARRAGAVSISLEYCGCAEVAAQLGTAGLQWRESNPVFAVQHAALPPPSAWYLTGFDRDTD
jgi:hypothetical protein